MKEEANSDVGLGLSNFLSEHLRKQHEVIVVDPDHIVVLHVGRDGARKLSVDFLIRLPCFAIEVDVAWMVVEQGP